MMMMKAALSVQLQSSGGCSLSKHMLHKIAGCLTVLGAADALSGNAALPDVLLSELANLKTYAERRLLETNQPYSPSPDYPYWNIFPAYVSSVFGGAESVAWSSKCFASNSIAIRRDASKDSFTVTIISSHEDAARAVEPMDCVDFYLLACTSTSKDFVVSANGHGQVTTEFTLYLPADVTSAERFDIDNKGFRLSAYPNGPATTFSNLLETIGLFEPSILGFISDAAAERNLDFLNNYTNFDDISYVDPASFIIPDESLIHDGQF